MFINTYFKPNIHQNGPNILGDKIDSDFSKCSLNFLNLQCIKQKCFFIIEEVEELLKGVFVGKINFVPTIQIHLKKSFGISNNVILILILDMTYI
jgi:hypothetical protein